MISESLMETLELAKARKIQRLPKILRPFFEEINFKNRAIIILGARGVGKTTFVLSKIKGKKIFYLSADNPLISTSNLWEIGNKAFMSGYEGITIDEVHYAKDWSVNLKSLYDDFPDKTIIATDSNSMLLRSGIGDLSRRFSKIQIPLMSFREYIALKEEILLPKVDPFRPNESDVKKIIDSTNVLANFTEFLKAGLRPSFLEWDYKEQIENIIEKTIHSDIPFFVPQISDIHFRLMNAVIGFLAISKVPTLNIDKMCTEWGIGKIKLYQLLTVMEETGLIKIVRYPKDTKTFSKGAKIFFADPSIYSVLNGDIGTKRESYVVEAFSDSGKQVFACKDERNGDFVINGTVVEIGGQSKKIKKADYVIRDDIDIPYNNVIPLWLIGFM